MPFSVAALAISAYGAYSSAQAGKAGAKAQQNSANASIAEQQREYDQTRQDQLPFLQAGQNAVGLQQKFLNGDTSGFMNSPDYQFALQQGTKQLDAGATAHGNLWGGGADADRIALGQGLATQYANNYWSKLAQQAGQGQTSATNLGAQGANMANQIGQQNNNIGAARASSYTNTANAWNNFGNTAQKYIGYGSNGNEGGFSIGPGTIGAGV